MIITLTGPSGTGKTTIRDRIVELKNFFKLYNYTTRNPRSTKELDDYIFLTKKQFQDKLKRWEFSENTEYMSNFYALGKVYDKNKNYIVVVEPHGLEVLKEYCKAEGIELRSFYIDLDEGVRQSRMLEQGRDLEEVRMRILNDKQHFRKELLQKYNLVRIVNNNLEKSVEEIVNMSLSLWNYQLEHEKN